jgi:hypothetical protein
MGTESWEAELASAVRPPSARGPRRRPSKRARNLTNRSGPFERFLPAYTCRCADNAGAGARKLGISRRIRCAKGDGA